jgi:hypothetical protein
MAWVEDCKLPQTLSSLQPDQRILCYDNLAKTLTYAPVVKVEGSKNADWVQVTLEDGSVLNMTKDHPVAAQTARNLRNGALMSNQLCIHAAELQPQENCLMMLKIVWTPISSVKHFTGPKGDSENTSASDLDKEWITLTVKQPERHEIFVTQGDKNGLAAMPTGFAVGSADRFTSCGGEQPIRNTFLHFHADGPPELRRSKSDPCLNTSAIAVNDAVEARTGRHAHRHPKGSQRSSSAGSKRSSHCSSNLTSTLSSPCSEGGGDSACVVKVGPPSGEGRQEVASLSDILLSRNGGFPSIGSKHPPGQCQFPCAFHFTNVRHPDKLQCKAGVLCEFCHDVRHHPKWKSRLRKTRSKPLPASNTTEKMIESL